MRIEWVLNKLKQKIFAVSHTKAVLHGDESDKTLDKVLEEVFDGTQQVGDSKKLNGKSPSEYVLVNGTSYPYYPNNKTEEAIDGVYDSLFSNASDNSYSVAIVDHNIAHSILSGGRHIVETFRATALYGYQITTCYDHSGVKRIFRSKINDVWKQWDSYLPLSGGTIKSPFSVPLTIKSTSDSSNRIAFEFSDKVLGYLGFAAQNKPSYYTAGGGIYDLIHTGNMAEHVLPKTGGTLAETACISFKPHNSGGNAVGLYFGNNDGSTFGGIGMLATNGIGKILYLSVSPTPYDYSGLAISANNIAWNGDTLHHDGNSARVAIQSTAPTDGLWVW